MWLGFGDRLSFGVGRLVAGAVDNEGFGHLPMLRKDRGGLRRYQRVGPDAGKDKNKGSTEPLRFCTVTGAAVRSSSLG